MISKTHTLPCQGSAGQSLTDAPTENKVVASYQPGSSGKQSRELGSNGKPDQPVSEGFADPHSAYTLDHDIPLFSTAEDAPSGVQASLRPVSGSRGDCRNCKFAGKLRSSTTETCNWFLRNGITVPEWSRGGQNQFDRNRPYKECPVWESDGGAL